MKSWDSFQIPMPFTRVAFCYGRPIEVPRRATDAQMEECQRALKEGLEEATARAEEEIERRG